MKINVSIYEYNDENHSPLKGYVYFALNTDNPHNSEEELSIMKKMILSNNTVADLCKLYGVRAGEVGVHCSYRDDDGDYIDGEYLICRFDGDVISFGEI